MKFVNIGGEPPTRVGLQLGDVVAAKGPGPAHWVVVGLAHKVVHLLGINAEGDVVSTASYALHAVENRRVVGRCADVADWQPRIVWDQGDDVS